MRDYELPMLRCSDPSLEYKKSEQEKKKKLLKPDAGVGLWYTHTPTQYELH